MSDECPRCESYGGFGCYECIPKNDDSVQSFEVEGEYLTWRWCDLRKCWEASIPVRIHPNGNHYVTSHADAWNTPENPPITFAAAERAALEIEDDDT